MFASALKSGVDWDYHAEKTSAASKIYPKGSSWPRGKMLGGSSSINYMIYLRGNDQDYDDWEALGNPGWDFKSILDYFKKSENNLAIDMLRDGRSYHGVGGPLKVDFFCNSTTSVIFEQAARELGYNIVDEFNGGKYLGFAKVQGTVFNGTRQSTAKAFLTPIKNRANLHVVKNALVTQLLFNANNDRVEGVHFVVHDKECVVNTRKEVILCAGAINTPQILMLSGIGPLKHLRKHQIECKHNLPVGQNLQDHLYVPLFFKFHNLNSTLDSIALLDIYYGYIRNKMGPLATIGVLDCIGFVNTLNSSIYPDIQYHHYAFSRNTDGVTKLSTSIGFNQRIISELEEINQDMGIGMALVTLLKPESRGQIFLRSNDPHEKPKIVSKYLKQKADVETVVRGIELYEQFLTTPSFQNAGAELIRFNLTECDVYDYQSPEYWECYSRYFSTSLYHPVGTAKMGNATDITAVVDPKLKVYGVESLRVVDASIMPNIVSADTNAAAIMIGEKGAALVKELWPAVQY